MNWNFFLERSCPRKNIYKETFPLLSSNIYRHVKNKIEPKLLKEKLKIVGIDQRRVTTFPMVFVENS